MTIYGMSEMRSLASYNSINDANMIVSRDFLACTPNLRRRQPQNPKFAQADDSIAIFELAIRRENPCREARQGLGLSQFKKTSR
jgi:hypothetical protein